MPWTSKDASRFTRKATSKVRKRQWKDVANSELKRGLPEGRAIAAANSAVKRSKRKQRRDKRGSRRK